MADIARTALLFFLTACAEILGCYLPYLYLRNAAPSWVLAGLTGTGGGIFLSPLLLFTGWSETRQTSGVSSAFILANSVSGLAGNWTAVKELPPALPLWIVAAALGGTLGAHLGSGWLATATLRRLLAAVLVIAALKLLLV